MHLPKIHKILRFLLACAFSLVLCAYTIETSPLYAIDDADLVWSMTQRNASGQSAYGNVSVANFCNRYQEFYPVPGSLPSSSCHIQGVSVGGGQVTLSCQDNGSNVARLQAYSLSGFGSSALPRSISLRWGALDHPVVGTGADHWDITDTSTRKTYYYPVVTTNVDNREQRAVVDVLEAGTDRVVCSFQHEGRAGDRTLGAASLVVQTATTYLATCGWDCNDFYIYKLNLARSDCGAELRGQFAVKTNSSLRINQGAGDANWGAYNGIALFANTAGQVFMIATHSKFMDTWRIQGFEGAASGVRFRKLAKFNWDGTWSGDGKYYFREGLAVERVTDSRIAIWLAPHDYAQRSNCAGAGCTRVYRCERNLLAP